MDRIEREMEKWGFPDRKGAISDLRSDDRGNLWVEHYRWVTPDEMAPEPQPTEWTVFGSTGQWLGEVEVPARFMLRDVRGDRVVGIHVDQNDVQSIRVYPLVISGREPAA